MLSDWLGSEDGADRESLAAGFGIDPGVEVGLEEDDVERAEQGVFERSFPGDDGGHGLRVEGLDEVEEGAHMPDDFWP